MLPLSAAVTYAVVRLRTLERSPMCCNWTNENLVTDTQNEPLRRTVAVPGSEHLARQHACLRRFAAQPPCGMPGS